MSVRRKLTPQGPNGGRVTIPPEFMQFLGVHVGDFVEVAMVSGAVGDVLEVRKVG